MVEVIDNFSGDTLKSDLHQLMISDAFPWHVTPYTVMPVAPQGQLVLEPVSTLFLEKKEN
jgi:hypothetical protein